MSDHGSRNRPIPGAAAARVAGYVLVLMFFSLAASSNGLQITFRDSQTSSSPGELNFWLGHALLLFPASLLIGYGFADRIYPVISAGVQRIRALDDRERITLAIAATVLAAAIFRLLRAVFLLDFPITDDEYAVEFGGRVLASGHVMAHLPLPREALPDLFLYFRDGAVGSFDWIGGQAIAAVAYLTALGPFVWALVAAIPLPTLAVLMTRRLGVHWGAAAVAVFFCSPMALLMSMTTHAQLASRAFFGLAILAFWRADRSGGWRRWALAGACFGLSFLCRPLETVFFSSPLIVWTAYQTVRRVPEYRLSLAGLVLGGFACAVIFLWHSYAMTGNPLLPARFAVPANTDVMGAPLWNRIGDNVTYNTLMLAVWFLGPLGLVLIAAGVFTDRFTKLLGACVLADLCLALSHDNPGLHIVGPIHYAECAVPLIVIATHGLANLLRGARGRGFDARLVAAPAAVALVLGLGIFSFVQAAALKEQAGIQRTVYDVVERAAHDASGGRSVVLTPWLFAVVGSVPAMRAVGTWVHDWRRPQLDLSDDVLFLRDAPGIAGALQAQLPDRKFFRIQGETRWPVLQLVPLGGGAPIPLTGLSTAGR